MMLVFGKFTHAQNIFQFFFVLFVFFAVFRRCCFYFLFNNVVVPVLSPVFWYVVCCCDGMASNPIESNGIIWLVCVCWQWLVRASGRLGGCQCVELLWWELYL